MARKPDPERIYAARRAGHLSRLMAEGHLSEPIAERWLAAWENEATERHLDRFKSEWWDPAWAWLAEQRRTR